MADLIKQQRPSTGQLQDLHVYLIPTELWRQNLNNAANEVITDSISLGFLRVSPQIFLTELRHEILQQLGDEYLPRDYSFLKSVGRCLTQVKSRQERELRVKYFLPPHAYSPELFILDSNAGTSRNTSSTPALAPVNKSESYDSQHSITSPLHVDLTPPITSENPKHSTRHVPQSQSGSQVFYNSPKSSTKPGSDLYEQRHSHDISAIAHSHMQRPDSNGSDFQHDGQMNGSLTYNTSNSKNLGTVNKKAASPASGDVYSEMQSKSPRKEHFNQTTILDEPNMLPQTNHNRSKGSNSMNKGVGNQQNTTFIHNQVVDSSERQNEATVHVSSKPTDIGQTMYRRLKQDYNEIHRNDIEHERQDRHDSDPEGLEDGFPSAERSFMSATPTHPLNSHKSFQKPELSKDEERFSETEYSITPETKEHESMLQRSSQSEEIMLPETHSRQQEEKAQLSEKYKLLLRELEEVRLERHNSEKRREELIKKARAIQARTNNRRNQARELWKQKYYNEKKKTPALEAEYKAIKDELEATHTKHLTAIESARTDSKPQGTQHLEAVQLKFEVDELQRLADAAKIKLTAEMKLRNQAETELRALRAELTQKKMNMSMSKNQNTGSQHRLVSPAGEMG